MIEIKLLPSTQPCDDHATLTRKQRQDQNAGTQLLRLPGELRNKIYVAVLGGYIICAALQDHNNHASYFCNVSSICRQVAKSGGSLTELWRVCRQLYVESRLIPYTANAFDDTYFYRAWKLRSKNQDHTNALRYVTTLHVNDLGLLRRYLRDKPRSGQTLDGLKGPHLFGMNALQTIVFSSGNALGWIYLNEDENKVQLWQGEKIQAPKVKDIAASEAEGQAQVDKYFHQKKAEYEAKKASEESPGKGSSGENDGGKEDGKIGSDIDVNNAEQSNAVGSDTAGNNADGHNDNQDDPEEIDDDDESEDDKDATKSNAQDNCGDPTECSLPSAVVPSDGNLKPETRRVTVLHYQTYLRKTDR